MNTENRKTNKPHKFIFNFSQRLDLRSSNEHVYLQNLFLTRGIYIKKKQYENNKLKIIAPTWNDEFDLSDGSYSVSYIQDYIKYIIRKLEILTKTPPIHVYINRINNRLMFKIKDGYRL